MQQGSEAKGQKIARNTIYLYLRTFVIVLISLYTSRVILQALGEVDFGIYNVVGGVVVLFSFINTAMTSSTQRYLNYNIEGNDPSRTTTHVFSQAMAAHLIVALGIILLGETVGLYIVETKLNIPADKESAAFWVYQLSILTTVGTILRCPYSASIIAYEEMSFFAWFSIIEGALKLGVALLIKICPSDRLIIYAILMAGISVLVALLHYIFCRSRFPEIRFRYRKDYRLLKEMSLFSTWSLLGSATTVGINQGASIILNIFFGVIVNSAMGIANRLNVVANLFVSNLQTAFMPQITKSYAGGDLGYLKALVLNASRYSFLLLFIVSAPVFFNCEYILALWLGEVPEFTSGLVRIIIIGSIFDAMAWPLYTAVQAKGKIRNYQICVSLISLLNLILLYLVAKAGYDPILTFGTKIPVLAGIYLFQLRYLDKVVNIRLSQWFGGVFRIIVIMIAGITAFSFLLDHIGYPLLRLAAYTALGIALAAFIGLSSAERVKVIGILRDKFQERKLIK